MKQATNSDSVTPVRKKKMILAENWYGTFFGFMAKTPRPRPPLPGLGLLSNSDFFLFPNYEPFWLTTFKPKKHNVYDTMRMMCVCIIVARRS